MFLHNPVLELLKKQRGDRALARALYHVGPYVARGSAPPRQKFYMFECLIFKRRIFVDC